jgi:uncharacterized membrane protein YgdD (TMEM256/DUF423 family)
MNRSLMMTCAAVCFLGVALGAFGAHGLKAALGEGPEAERRLGWWETGARYQLIHGLALGLAAVVAGPRTEGWALWAAVGFLVGVALFSGSLYVMALTGLRWLGAVTPLGGLAQLAGWVALGMAAWSKPAP